MSLELNARKLWECSGNEHSVINLRRPNFVAQDDECHRRGGKQALTVSIKKMLLLFLQNNVQLH